MITKHTIAQAESTHVTPLPPGRALPSFQFVIPLEAIHGCALELIIPAVAC